MSSATMTIEKRLYTSKETMEYLGVKKTKFHELVDLGILKNVSLDSNFRFDKIDLDQLIEMQKTKSITDLIKEIKEKNK